MDKNSSSSQRRTLLATGGLALVLLLVAMDQTIVATALPRIAADLHGFSLYSWVTTAYLLAATTAMPIAGKLGDLYGRKWVTVTGVALFVGFSSLCGLAPNMLWLVIFRGLQGLGGGTVMSTVFALVADIYPDPVRRARYQGIFSSVFVIASIIAPFVGGILTDSFSWRAIFYVNLPLGLLALAVLPRVLPTSERVKDVRIDFLGAITITIGIVAFLLALTSVGSGTSWTVSLVLIELVVTVVSIGLFIPIELRAAQPIVPLSLFRNRTLLPMTGVMFLFGAAMFGVTLYVPLFVQVVLGQSATGSGTILLPLVIMMSVSSILIGQIIGRIGSIRTFIVGGMALFTVGAFLLSTLGVGTSTLLVSAYLFIIGIGLGTTMPLTTLAVQSSVEKSNLGSATSMTQFIRSIGSTVGTAVIAWVVTAGYRNFLTANAPSGASSSLLSILSSPNALIIAASRSALNTAARIAGETKLVEPLLEAARFALSSGIHNGMLLIAGFGMLAVVIAALLPRITFSKEQPKDTVVQPVNGSVPEKKLIAL